jgi:TPR repeat protein
MTVARLTLLISVLSLPGYGSAVSMAGALELWYSGDRSAAIVAWRRLAEAGDVEASLFLGYVYRRGLGVARDDEQALTWYRRAAERGQPEAQYELALMYELGLGVAPDPNEAAVWYGLSTAQACPAELRAGGRLGDR